MSARKAVVIGAGPAGLTAAYELLDRTDVVPLVVEADDCVGGISRTVNYKGNRIDIGGHRFFSKSDRVMDWWMRRMPVRRADGDGASSDMLVRNRKSRIYFLRRFFDYPLRLNLSTVANLGLWRMTKIAMSYASAAATAKKNPKNLEEFFIGRFGRELYLTFFKSYTEKVWGVRCADISAEWGAQRIKGLSIGKAAAHFLKNLVPRKSRDLSQKNTETSLIEEFLYPKHGPGQMWENVADEVTRRGGQILFRHKVVKLHAQGDRIVAVDAVDRQTGETKTLAADFVFSTMPVKDLILGLDSPVPEPARQTAEGLIYRDFITVGLLVKRLKVSETAPNGQRRPITDQWIYIQEPDVRLGRLQVFNNWSPYMVADPATTWVGLEYFCFDTDPLWRLSDRDMIELGKTELAKIGIIDADAVLDATVIHMPKTYPAYFGSYARFGEIREFLDRFANLFLIGRNGMHKYNNQDHSMLTAMTAVDNIAAGRTDKSNIWEVNTEQDYHEDKNGQ